MTMRMEQPNVRDLAAYRRKHRWIAFGVLVILVLGWAGSTFVLFVNDPDLLHFSYERYLLNKIRAAFPLAGTPVRIRTKSSHGEKPLARTPGRKATAKAAK